MSSSSSRKESSRKTTFQCYACVSKNKLCFTCLKKTIGTSALIDKKINTPFGVELQFVNTVTDGNCGYDALRFSNYVDAKTPKECRANLFAIVNNNLDLYFKIYVILTNTAKQPPESRDQFRKWIQKHSQNGVWACNISLTFAAFAYNVDIISMHENGIEYFRPLEEMSVSLPSRGDIPLVSPSGTLFIINTGSSNGTIANHFVYGKPIGAPVKVVPFIATKWGRKCRGSGLGGEETSDPCAAEIDLSHSGDENDDANNGWTKVSSKKRCKSTSPGASTPPLSSLPRVALRKPKKLKRNYTQRTLDFKPMAKSSYKARQPNPELSSTSSSPYTLHRPHYSQVQLISVQWRQSLQHFVGNCVS